MLFSYYIFLWFAMFYNSVGIFKIHQSLIKLEEAKIVEKNSFYEKIKYFPCMLIIWWIFPTIHRIYQMSTGEDSFFLASMHVFCESSYGCINFLLYAMNPRVRASLVENIRRILGKEKAENMEKGDRTFLMNNSDKL